MGNRFAAEPVTPAAGNMLDWALHWIEQGLFVFPCKQFVGTPIVTKWYREASKSPAQVVEWWSEAPCSDIAAVPYLSGHFVIVVQGDEGQQSFLKLEQRHGRIEPAFIVQSVWGDAHYWFEGQARSGSNLIGAGLRVFGPGTFVYLSPSLSPDPDIEGDKYE